ncbi:MAG: DNA-3-methyladenine glycosylase 2 family protein [Ilumatobacter sp.]|nr:DNA-3-methyladenine glycosylase 2 family protein [Ilumatobacter sp.]
MPTPTTELVRERLIDLGSTLGWYRHGRHDPTTWLTVVGRGTTSSGDFVRATWTPDGPGTLHIQWRGNVGATDVVGVPGVSLASYGPGGAWLTARAPLMIGVADPGDPALEHARHPVVAAAARAGRSLRFGASGDLYHELLPTILEQRITAGEAYRQWGRLCAELGEPAPGPFARLLLPPDPARLARQPSWWFHPLGVERKRAQPLALVARHADKYWQWAAMSPTDAGAKLRLIDGVGQWTIGSVLGPALGDPDAVAVGDYHLKNVIGNTLAGEARATDERMLELLRPYAGQRGRVVRMLCHDGASTPKFGPRHRVLPMHRW